MTKKHATPQARRNAEATLRAMARELEAEFLGAEFLGVELTDNNGEEEWFVLWYDGTVSGDSLDDAYINALHKKAGTEPPPKEWG